MGNNASVDLNNSMFELKFASKQLNREHERSMKQFTKSKKLVAKYIADGKPDVARNYAKAAMEHKKAAVKFLQMSAKCEACVSRLRSTVNSKMVSSTIVTVLQGMDQAVKSLDIVAIGQVMDRFEEQTGTLNVAVDEAHSTLVSSDEVENLMAQLQDEQEVELDFPEVQQRISPLELKQDNEHTIDDRLASLI